MSCAAANTRPPGEAEAYADLEARACPPGLESCDGCTRCATRCVDHIDLSYPEFARLVAHLRSLPEAAVREVVGQDKRLFWEEIQVSELCPFLDRRTDLCLIYPARPLICRLFGHVAWLPCPRGMVPEGLPEAPALMREYAALERHPLREWLARTGLRLPGFSPA